MFFAPQYVSQLAGVIERVWEIERDYSFVENPNLLLEKRTNASCIVTAFDIGA